MGIISVENTDRLYWLGRYSERVYTTIKLFADSYDDMIDYYFDSYAEFCRRLDIPNIYDSRETFIARYCFDPDDPNSIHANRIRAYDNCVVLREAIGSETVSYIQLAMYDMNRARASQAPLVELQKVTDNILAFWGIADDSIDSENVRNLIKVGKRVERLDLYARLRMPVPEMQREFHRLAGRIGRTCLKYNEARLARLSELVEAPEIDYAQVVSTVEALTAFAAQFSFPADMGALDRACTFMDGLHDRFVYTPGVTDIHTTAEQAMALGQGVCQDYAHILLSLCRMEQIPCRYVVGMLLGEGLSHAWVEIADGERWYALDPTNRLLVDDQHIKISAGRDYTDCTINQGLFVGRTRQTQQAVVSVQEEKKP